MQKHLWPWLLTTTLFLTACFPGVYKLDIQQGNIIERDKITQLHPGMSKRQVRYLLGTPMTVDSFNQNRWDYYYSLKDGKDNFRQERLVWVFEGGQLSKIDNQVPADSPPPAVSSSEVKMPDSDTESKAEE